MHNDHVSLIKFLSFSKLIGCFFDGKYLAPGTSYNDGCNDWYGTNIVF